MSHLWLIRQVQGHSLKTPKSAQLKANLGSCSIHTLANNTDMVILDKEYTSHCVAQFPS